MTGLAGTGFLADDMWLIAHHEISGKPYVQPRALGIGLASGLLAELMLEGQISLRDGAVTVASRTPPEDGLERHVLGQVAGEYERHPVQTWLHFVGRTAADDVARRLESAGYVTRAGGRRFWGGGRWVPVDADNAFAPVLRVRAVLDAGRPLTAHGAVLAGLVTACGLGFRLAQYAPPRAGRSAEQAVAQLDPRLRELVAQTQAAVDSALLAHRV